MIRAAILKGSGLAPIRRFVKEGKAFQPMVRRFIAGDTLDDAMAVTEDLLRRGFMVSLDFLGENTRSRDEALASGRTYTTMLRRIGERNGHRSFEPAGYPDGLVEPLNISIKLTQCGLDQSKEFAEENVRKVARAAADLGVFVRVDMEGSAYTQATMDIVTSVYADFPNVGLVLQSYLYRTATDIETAVVRGIRVRLVKGAYLETPPIAIARKSAVDAAYLKQAKRLLVAGVYPALATHDGRLICELLKFVADNQLAKDHFEFQMLYGIRRDLQDALLKEGYRVRIYLPFGDAWYPYFARRIAERPANGMFVLKSLFLK